MVGKAIVLAWSGMLDLLQKSWNIFNLRPKLSFSPEYFVSSVYKRIRVASSFPYSCCCCSGGCSIPGFVTGCSGLATCSGISVLAEGIGVGFGGVGVGIGGVGAGFLPPLLLSKMLLLRM